MMRGFWIRFWILAVLVVICVLTAQFGLLQYLEK